MIIVINYLIEKNRQDKSASFRVLEIKKLLLTRLDDGGSSRNFCTDRYSGDHRRHYRLQLPGQNSWPECGKNRVVCRSVDNAHADFLLIFHPI